MSLNCIVLQMKNNDLNWWKNAVVYQVYPRSFADSNGDGIGDLKGIASRVSYLKDLGVDALWISPFYPSALIDGGYDVDNYRDIDPRLGTLEDFDNLLQLLHKVDIKVYIDIVPNHSSNSHQWFKDAINSQPGSLERDRYIFRDGRGLNGELPPTDWPSHFAPSAWTHERVMGGKFNQWYMHYFAPEQPDFNWDNQEVNDDFIKTLEFWSDRGVDGFRVDVAHGLKKDLSEPLRMRDTLEHIVDRPRDGKGILADRDEVFEVYKRWREVFNRYNPPKIAVAEANVVPERIPLYASAETLGQCFDFRFLELPFRASVYRESVESALNMSKLSKSSCTWALSNHDQIRHATKLGLHPMVNRREWLLSNGTSNPLDMKAGTQAALAATMFLMALPGAHYLYQGEELGLHEVYDIPESEIQDPQYLKNNKVEKGRDGCRVPLPWSSGGSSFGFGSGGAHLPQPSWFKEFAVEVQESDKNSTLNKYREIIKVRKSLITDDEVIWVESANSEILHFKRSNGWQCLTNFYGEEYPLPLKSEIIYSSRELTGNKVPLCTTVWFRES